jgi:phenylacetate-coenzyme A ligase PaaK-like adenylate-forming protein
VPGLATRIESIAAALQSSGWDHEELAAYQDKRIRKLVRHAFHRVPYYHDLFERHGCHPDEVEGLKDLGRMPIATRAEMQERPAGDLVAAGYDPAALLSYRTSGSTGAPLTLRRTRFEDRLLQGLRLKEMGLHPTDTRAVVVGPKRRQPDRDLNARLGLFRRVNVNCLLPSREILDRLAAIQPDVLGGYAGSLSWLAGEATEEDRRRIRPRLMITAAETLTPDMRRLISECFGARIVDVYAAHEFNMIGRECEKTGLYHVSNSSVVAEVLRDGEPVEPGESGELVGTALHSFAMPFFRYRLDDAVTLGPPRCPCGAANRTLERIEGRVMDRFPLPGGSTIHPYKLIRPFNQDCRWLRRYQIVQKRIDHVLVRTVPLPGCIPADEDWQRIRAELQEKTGPGVTFAFETVAELPPAKSGKFRPYYSEVRKP